MVGRPDAIGGASVDEGGTVDPDAFVGVLSRSPPVDGLALAAEAAAAAFAALLAIAARSNSASCSGGMSSNLSVLPTMYPSKLPVSSSRKR